MDEDRTRNIFPSVRSILNADALAEVVREMYALDVTNCELLKPKLSDLYRVDTTDGPYILRVYPAGLNLARWIEAELSILQRLDAGGIPVSLPIPRRDGKFLLPLDAPEGERSTVLFGYAHGRSLKRAGSPDDFYAFGQVAAKMHQVAAGLPEQLARVPLDAYTLLARPLELLGAAYPERAAEVEELRDAAELIGRDMEGLRRHRAAWGFCHGNLNFSNVHIDAQGSFCLFNFEYCGPGWPVYDIATVLNFENRDAARAFLEGYETQRPLLDAERAALGSFQAANKLWMLGAAASLTGVYGDQIVGGAYFDQVLELFREKFG